LKGSSLLFRLFLSLILLIGSRKTSQLSKRGVWRENVSSLWNWYYKKISFCKTRILIPPCRWMVKIWNIYFYLVKNHLYVSLKSQWISMVMFVNVCQQRKGRSCDLFGIIVWQTLTQLPVRSRGQVFALVTLVPKQLVSHHFLTQS
jgi:hypothetical protein